MKFLKPILTILVTFICLISCQKNTTSAIENQNLILDEYYRVPLNNSGFAEMASDFCKSKNLSIDIENSLVVKSIKSNICTIILKAYSSVDSKNVPVLIIQDDKIVKIFYSRINNSFSNITTIDLYDQKLVPIITSRFDGKLKSVVSEWKYSSSGLRKDCGQAVANCVTDKYENHGWTSVALVAATALDPMVGLAVIAGCVLAEC